MVSSLERLSSTMKDGKISANLFGLQLQLKTVLEEAGGDAALSFLDSLSKLNRSEQEVMLKIFTRLTDDIANGDNRLFTDGDLALKSFEEGLYREILDAMRDAAKRPAENKNRKLEVLDGGKASFKAKTPEEISRKRKVREFPKTRPVLN